MLQHQPWRKAASVPYGFDPEQQALLRGFSSELAFAIVTLCLRAERNRLEGEQLKSAQREQERIGREMHDGLCQVLVAAKYQSAYLASLAKRPPAGASNRSKCQS